MSLDSILVWRGVLEGGWATASIATALLVTALAAWFVYGRLQWLRRGPRVATAQQLVKTYYAELGVGQAQGSVGRAWACLDPVAQARFESVDGLQAYRKGRMNELAECAMRATEHVWSNHRPEEARQGKWITPWDQHAGEIGCSVGMGKLTVQTISERGAEVAFDVSITVWDSVPWADRDEQRYWTICYGILGLPQCKTLLKAEDRWYLTSGTLDGLKAASPSGIRVRVCRSASLPDGEDGPLRRAAVYIWQPPATGTA